MASPAFFVMIRYNYAYLLTSFLSKLIGCNADVFFEDSMEEIHIAEADSPRDLIASEGGCFQQGLGSFDSDYLLMRQR